MALIRNSGFQNDMPQTFSSMLDRFFNESVNSRSASAFTPHVDACETEKGFEIEVALPGIRKEDISIDFQEGKLTISGERKMEKKEEDRRYHMIETQYGSFTRTFYLPDNVNPDQIKAELSDGILQVFVPKDEHKTQKRQIKIASTSDSKGTQKQKRVAETSDNKSAVNA